ncbi:HK97 family phage prohead protease [Candidatus Microgenomates bacterium]|nr:HK97 family phage prohead protease [Candidatus Microgenomates bacterium]
MSKAIIRKTYQDTETKAGSEDRTLMVKITTSNPDRSQDVVVPQGAVLDNYQRNPVVALNHKYDGLAIAKTEQLDVTSDGILARVKFPDIGVYDLADTVYELYKGGFMNAWSIGFIPLESSDRDGGGREFKKWELLEYSAVLVPDNPEALTMLRSKGIQVTDEGEIIETKDVTPSDGNQDAEASAGENSQEESPQDESSETPPAEAVADVSVGDQEEKPKENEGNSSEAEEESEDEAGDKSLTEDKEIKEGRMLSEKNRKMVTDCLEQLKNTQTALQALIDASAKEPKDLNGDQLVVIDLAEALKAIDKVAGVALRDLKRKVYGELGTVPEDSRVPIVIGEGGGK